MSHELDEFLMVEKPLTHTKRKAHPDLEKMKPELRQLEEQYVVARVYTKYTLTETSLRRFTVYDFTQSRRMSYYPHNQPITSAGHESDGEPVEVVQSATNTVQPTATIVERSRPGTPFDELDATGRETPYPMPTVTHHSERQPSQ